MHISDALDTIMKSGVTTGSKTTLRSEMNRWIRNHRADWDQVAIGMYRYQRFEHEDLEDR